MRFEGAYYTNLSHRTDRDYFMRKSLAGQDFPLDKIFRIEGVDASNFASIQEAISVLSETYPEMNQINPMGWTKKGDVCCIAAWKNALTRIYNELTEEGIALYLLDDKLVRNLFWFFEDLIASFRGNVDIVQLFSWDGGTERPKRVQIQSPIHRSLYVGVVYPGDAALLLSKRGAKNILDVYRERTSYFPETLFYDYSEKFQNFYTVTHSYEWIGHGFISHEDSDRVIMNRQ